MPRLTDLSLKTLAAPDRQITVWDGPLGVRVTPRGTKTFITMLGSGKRHTIGRYPLVSLSQARQVAIRLKAEKTLGKVFPERHSVAQVRELYLTEITVRPNTRKYYTFALNRLSGKLADITPHEITRILASLNRGYKFTFLASYKVFFNWCIQKHYLDRSPCERMKTKKPPSRTRVLSDEELRLVWQVCELAGQGAEGELPTRAGRVDAVTTIVPRPLINPTFAKIVRLLILTGQRRGEIASLHSSWLGTDSITLPPEVTKNGREHTCPLSALASSLLASAPHSPWQARHQARGANDYILFPSARNPQRPFSFWQAKDDLDTALSGSVKPFTLHDLRRTFATRLAELGVAPHVIERLLNHITGTLSPIALVYNRAKYMVEMRDAVDLWERHLQNLLAR